MTSPALTTIIILFAVFLIATAIVNYLPQYQSNLEESQGKVIGGGKGHQKNQTSTTVTTSATTTSSISATSSSFTSSTTSSSTTTTTPTTTTTTTTAITYPPGVYNITIIAHGQYAGGAWPTMVLVLDKTQNLSTWTVASSSYQLYSVLVNIPDGTHEIGVTFTNDYYNSATGEDRNLYVQSIVINGFPNYPTSSNVIYDEPNGNYAFSTYFDGINVIPGQTGMAWSGALRFTLQFPFSPTVSVDFGKFQGTDNLSYGAHPTDVDIQSLGLMQTPFDKISSFNYSRMRFQYGRDVDKLCKTWNTTTNSCDTGITDFENWTVDAYQNNGYISTWLETANVHSGSHAFHFYASAPNPTNISLDYEATIIPIDETKYYEAGFWSFPIQNSRDVDISFVFYDAGMNQLTRTWGQSRLGSFSTGTWSKESFVWYPSSLGSGNGYISKGAKYAKLVIYEVWHSSGTFEAIDDDAFVRQFSSLPSTTTRQSAVTNNLVSNPSFEGLTSLGYDWTLLDKMIGAIKSVGAEPVISLPIGNFGNANELPAGMPLNYSVGQATSYSYGYFAAMTSYCSLLKAIVQHTNIDKGFNVKYWEIGNEPNVCNSTIEKAYVNYFNLADSCMHQVDPTILLTSDESFQTEFAQNYLIPYAKNIGFLSFHNYDAWGNPMYPSDSSNLQNIYYQPNDQHGWFSDATLMQNVNTLSGDCTQCWCTLSPKQAHDLYLSRTGKNLEIIITEINLNSVWENGTDSRQNDVFGAMWYAAKAKAYIMDGSNMNINYFVLSSWDKLSDDPMAKYGGFGFGMMNSSYPYTPYAPYWTNYLLTTYVKKGSLIYNSTSTGPYIIDALAVKSDNTYNILLISKINQPYSFRLNVNGLMFSSANLYYLDGTTYDQHYDSVLGQTRIFKSGIGSLSIPVSTSMTIPMNGYTVAVLVLT